MTLFITGLIGGVPLGVGLYRFYLRFLYKQMAFIRRQMRGGVKRKRH
jgi:hypothetical protein